MPKRMASFQNSSLKRGQSLEVERWLRRAMRDALSHGTARPYAAIKLSSSARVGDAGETFKNAKTSCVNWGESVFAIKTSPLVIGSC
ncbi:MAG: hypothetical protein H0X37_23590 [Herpetosiphonaceae bacterium]|nr:hypothetical protein [Herpetosiphonaceae bacterium]